MSKQALIEQALQALEPRVLQVEDESHMHSRGQETHYKAVVVSERFAGLNRVKRHQQVYAAMGELMPQVHALALHTYTAEEWQQQQSAPASPQCLGGSKHDH